MLRRFWEAVLWTGMQRDDVHQVDSLCELIGITIDELDLWTRDPDTVPPEDFFVNSLQKRALKKGNFNADQEEWLITGTEAPREGLFHERVATGTYPIGGGGPRYQGHWLCPEPPDIQGGYRFRAQEGLSDQGIMLCGEGVPGVSLWFSPVPAHVPGQ
jgi:hypothetical protein